MWCGAAHRAAAEITFAELDASGVALAAPVTVTEAGGTAGAASLVPRNGGWALAWDDRTTGNADVHFVELDPSGTPTSERVVVSNDATDSTSASLAVASSGYGVAWIDDPSDTTGTVLFASICP